MEDHCSMPSLQDMLEDFDASRLEELAESLLADVITDLATDSAPGGPGNATHEGTAERMPGRMVGTQPEQLESAQDSRDADGRLDCQLAAEPSNTEQNNNNNYLSNTDAVVAPSVEQQIVEPMPIQEDSETTLYGTYDEKTNCITIVLPDENIQLDEAVEEVQYSPSSSSVSLISPIPDSYLDDVSNVVCPVSPAHSTFSSNVSLADAKAPTLADSGYESFGSPAASSIGSGDMEPIMDFDDMWNDSFSELFPSLM